MIIEYIGNTCDVEGIKTEGEILILFSNGEPIVHYDLSDGFIEVDVISELLKPFGIDVEFNEIYKPSKQLIKKINKYLKEEGY